MIYQIRQKVMCFQDGEGIYVISEDQTDVGDGFVFIEKENSSFSKVVPLSTIKSFDEVQVHSKCGSTDIRILRWTDPNTDRIDHSMDAGLDMQCHWCKKCNNDFGSRALITMEEYLKK